jgi:Polysaccharide lyase
MSPCNVMVSRAWHDPSQKSSGLVTIRATSTNTRLFGPCPSEEDMRDRTNERQPRGLVVLAILLGAVAGCGSPASSGGAGGTGGEDSEGGAPGTGGGGGSASGGKTGSGGSAGRDAAPSTDASPDAGGGAGGSTCGMAGQMCCAGNTCMTGTPEQSGGGGASGMTVLELKASGTDPYKYFAEKDLLPMDGPDSGYVFDDGTSFQFVLHENGAEETVSSGAVRQRNEVTVNPGNPAIYKGKYGETMSYTWRFKLEKMNANPTWCDIWQMKQHGTLGPAPFMALEADKGNLNLDTQRLGVVTSVPLATIMNVWIYASVTGKYHEQGSLQVTLKKEDGTTVLSYMNNNINLWGAGLDFVRPKWGFYRNKRAGSGEASIRYNDMKIIRGTVGPSCACR